MARNANALRVAAGTDFGPRSGVWRIWSQGDEIYIAMRSIASEFKTSLHSSGEYRNAFTKQKYVGDGDPALMRWTEPPESAPGFRHIYEIVIPTAELTVPLVEPPAAEKAKILLIDPAPEGHAVVVSIVLTNPGLEVAGHPVPAGGVPSILLAKWTLPNGRAAWIVASHQPLDDAFWALVSRARQEMARQVAQCETQPTGQHLRVALWTHSPELALGRYLDLAGDVQEAATVRWATHRATPHPNVAAIQPNLN